LQKAGLVVVNLSGFTADHPGLAYELVHVLRPPSPAPEVFLIDSLTDADAAIDFVTRAWRTANAQDPLVFVRLPVPADRPARSAPASLRTLMSNAGLSGHVNTADSSHIAHRIWTAVRE
jgi:hypothetical protein